MATLTLSQTLNMIAEDLNHAGGERGAMSSEELSIYSRIDPTYSKFRKQYEDAKARYNALKKIFSRDLDFDPMLDVAEWQMDSAKSAMDTRLIELRADKAVQDYIVKIQERVIPNDDAHSISDKLQNFTQKMKVNRRLKDNKNAADGRAGFFMVVVLLQLLARSLDFTHKKLSLACSFRKACNVHI